MENTAVTAALLLTDLTHNQTPRLRPTPYEQNIHLCIQEIASVRSATMGVCAAVCLVILTIFCM